MVYQHIIPLLKSHILRNKRTKEPIIWTRKNTGAKTLQVIPRAHKKMTTKHRAKNKSKVPPGVTQKSQVQTKKKP